MKHSYCKYHRGETSTRYKVQIAKLNVLFPDYVFTVAGGSLKLHLIQGILGSKKNQDKLKVDNIFLSMSYVQHTRGDFGGRGDKIIIISPLLAQASSLMMEKEPL